MILGKLVPAGTGMKCYSEVEIEPDVEPAIQAVPEELDFENTLPDIQAEMPTELPL